MHTTLDKLAESQPMFHELEDMAEDIIREFASMEDLSLHQLKPLSECDQLLENAQLTNYYLALYEVLRSPSVALVLH